jgi:hypothetical protein
MMDIIRDAVVLVKVAVIAAIFYWQGW